MVYEKSCGALVVRREEDNYYILMIRHKAGGNRSFPKGHVEGDESPASRHCVCPDLRY